ncbi:hypothetical protein TOC8171_32280 [Pseudomonas syringae]
MRRGIMHHKDLGDNTSELTYTFNLRLRPRWLGWMFDSLINRLFEIETRRRFAAMAKYLAGEHGQMPSNQDGTMNQ